MTASARCTIAVTLAFLFFFGFNPSCFSESAMPSGATNYRTVSIPFTALQHDASFRPHQLITIGIRKDANSPITPATFLFDTGANVTYISASLAKKLGLPQYNVTPESESHINIAGPDPKGIIATSLEVGRLNIQDFRFLILADQRLLSVVGQPIDGALGSDFWASFVTHIDFTHNQITFIVPTSTSLSYETLSQNSVELSSLQVAGQGFGQAAIVPLTTNNGSFFANAILKNGKAIVTAACMIDSGADATSLSESVAKKLGIENLFTRKATSVFGEYTDSFAWLPGLTCGDLKVNNLLVSSTDARSPQNSLLGLDVLANYDVLLDCPHRKMYLKPREDIQTVTSRQYEVASASRRRQWAQKPLIVMYASSSFAASRAIPYDLTPDGLPVAQVRPDLVTPPVSFLLKTNGENTLMSDTLARQWRMTTQIAVDEAGKPRLLGGEPVCLATVPDLHIAGATVTGRVGVFSAKRLLPYACYLSAQGIIGANVLLSHPLLMDPVTQTWMLFTSISQENLASLEMADAVVVNTLDPDGDSIPALAVQEKQGAAHYTDTLTLATGSPFTLLSAEAAKTLKLTPEPKKLSYGAGKDITVFNRAHLSQLSIGGVVLKDVEVAYPVGAMPDDFYPRLGMNVISKLRLLVDAPAKKMYVKKSGTGK